MYGLGPQTVGMIYTSLNPSCQQWEWFLELQNLYLATQETNTGNRSYCDCAKALYPQIEALFGMDGIRLQSKGADAKFKDLTVYKKACEHFGGC